MRFPGSRQYEVDPEKRRAQIDAASSTIGKSSASRPQPPRSLQYQESSRGALVTWYLPDDPTGIIAWRVYRETESNLYETIHDPGTRKSKIPLTAGSPSPYTPVFVSSLAENDRESEKVQINVKATDEAGAPVEASPPADYSSTGGVDTSYDPIDRVPTRRSFSAL